MNNFLNQNNVLHNLKGIVINKLNQMNYLLENGKIKESIALSYDILLILRSLKQNQRMIKLNQHVIQKMFDQLSNIDVKPWRDKVEKEELDNFVYNLQQINDITNFNYMAMLRMKCKEVKVNNIKKFQFQLKPIGLENIGATCYMNATLQVLSQIPELHDFFLYGPPRQESW